MTGEGETVYLLVRELGYKLHEIGELTPEQFTFLVEGLRREYKERERALRKVRRRHR